MCGFHEPLSNRSASRSLCPHLSFVSIFSLIAPFIAHSYFLYPFFALLSHHALFFVVLRPAQALYGETRPYVLNYFLADDTVEVMEVSSSMSGRDPFPALLKKQRLPKVRYHPRSPMCNQSDLELPLRTLD